MDGHGYDRFGDGERDSYQIDYRRIVGDTEPARPRLSPRGSTTSTARWRTPARTRTGTGTGTRPPPSATAPPASRPATSPRGESRPPGGARPPARGFPFGGPWGQGGR
ncbi:hypothetical protein ANANG_G00311370 [Anguilla anguilla]|uniref:Uncharacterized protein n=1 Tax=Anguilla anguilla TaxID=7936 RepID=A0A9D3RHZ7_ANGAN|nr:hypothetical protein ANANG_G00311370 [Anguilla anguilla]